MAASVDSNELLWQPGGAVLNKIKLSSLSGGLLENIAHKGPSGLAASEVRMQVITPPTDGSQLELRYEGTDTSNDQLDLRFVSSAGGSLSGAVVEVFAHFRESAAQDGTSLSAQL